MEKTKAAHSTVLPYCAPLWPRASPAIETDILQLLLPLLRPVGNHRREHPQRSKGRGRRQKQKVEQQAGVIEPAEVSTAVSSLNVGFNSVIRSLERLAQEFSPTFKAGKIDVSSATPLRPVVVLACPASMAPPTLGSLPLLVALASDKSEPIRLLQISASGETAISHALALPRVGVLALDTTLPGSQALCQYVRTTVAAIEVPWLEEAASSSYLPLKVSTTNVPISKKGSRKRKAGDGEEE